MKALLLKVLEYLMHASTWKGLVAVATAAGLVLTEVQAEALIAAGLGVVGLIQVFVDDHDKDKLEG